jgi:probable HAF family extracellular repeat protein
MKRLFLLVAVALGGVSRTTASGDPPAYWIVDEIPSLHGGIGIGLEIALGINEAGDVVGQSEVVPNPSQPSVRRQHAFLYRNDGELVDLTPDASRAAANAINDDGVVVGTIVSNIRRAFVYSGGTLVVAPGFIETPSGFAQRDCSADDVNALGIVTGHDTNPGKGNYDAYVAPASTFLSPSWLNLWSASFATGVSDAGHVCGWGFPHAADLLADTFLPFVTKDGVVTGIPVLGEGTSAYAFDVNSRGQVVGWSYTQGRSAFRPFLYADGVTTALPIPGGIEGFANAINERGDVVGFIRPLIGSGRAALWTGGEAVHLNDLIDPASGWDLLEAHDINESGWIVGRGLLDGHGFRAFRMRPPVALPTDSDADGLSDEQEAVIGTDPAVADTDGDGLLDGTEVQMAQGTGCPDPLVADSDGDSLLDGDEVALGTSPCDADTDGDGAPDDLDPSPLVDGASSSELVAWAGEIAEDLAATPLSFVQAANANAAAGRLGSLESRLRNAAKAVAEGDLEEAIDLLHCVLARMDGQPRPDDWLLPSETTSSLRREIEGLASLLD